MYPSRMLSGSCLCGAVRYRVAGPVGPTSHCHCSMCRKAHGAAFATYARVARADFHFSAGAEDVRSYESSAGVTRTFCGRCGANLQFIEDAEPGHLELALGTLDGDPGVRPRAHIFVASKAPWYEITDALTRFEGPPAKRES